MFTHSYSYDAYVNARNFTPDNAATKLLYAGEMYDSIAAQYYLRARWYSPVTGRFNRMDPFAGNNRDPQSLHKYLYAHCNPINGIDPSGLLFGGGFTGFVVGIGIGFAIAGLCLTITGVLTDNPALRDIGIGIFISGVTIAAGAYLLVWGGVMAVIGAESVATTWCTGAASAIITYAGALVANFADKVADRNEYKKFVEAYTYAYGGEVSRKIPPRGMVILRDLGTQGIPVMASIPDFKSGPPSYRVGDEVIAYSQQEDDKYRVRLTVYKVRNSGELKRKYDTESTITENPSKVFDPDLNEGWVIIEN